MADVKITVDSSDLQLLSEWLNKTDQKVKVLTKSAENNFQTFKKQRGELEQVRRSLDPLYAAARDFEAKLEVLNRELKNKAPDEYARRLEQLRKQASRAGVQLDRFNRVVGMTNKGTRRNELAMQQAGYQFQDFIVQVQSGTSPLIAFSQQGSQLAGFFAGPWGAAIGLGIAAVGGLGTAFLSTRDEAQDFGDALDDAVSSVDDLVSVFDDASSSESFLKFGNLKDTFEDLAGLSKTVAENTSRIKLSEAAGGLQGEFGKTGFFSLLGSGFTGINEILRANPDPSRASWGGRNPIDFQLFDRLRIARERMGSRDLSSDLGGALSPNQLTGFFAGFNQFSRGEDADIVALNDHLILFLQTVQKNKDALRGASEEGFAFIEKIDELAQTTSVYAAQIDGSAKKYEDLFEAGEDLAKDTLKALEDTTKADAKALANAKEKRQEAKDFAVGLKNELRIKGMAVGLEDRELLVAKQKQERIRQRNTLLEKGLSVNDQEYQQAMAALGIYQAFVLAAYDENEAKQQALDLEKLKSRAAKTNLSLSQQLKRSELALAEAKGESKKTDELRVKLAGEEAAQRILSQATTLEEIAALGEAASKARQVAEQAERNKIATEDAAENAKKLADAYALAARAAASIDKALKSNDATLAGLRAQAAVLRSGGGETEGEALGAVAKRRASLLRTFNVSSARELTPEQQQQLDKEVSEAQEEARLRAEIDRLTSDTSSKKIKSTQDEIDKLMEAVKVEETRLKVGEEEARQLEILQDLRRFNADADKDLSDQQLKDAATRIAQAEQEIQTLEDLKDRHEELADAMEGHFEDAFMSFVDHTKTAEEKFKEFASAVIKDLYRILVVQNMVNAAKMAFSGGGGPLAFLGNLFADGAAFSKGSVVPFATGGVVGSPTYFPMSGGRTGLMGEAGPEAIMPLKRGKDGKLGVASEGTSDTIVVNNSFNFAANGDDSVKRIITQSMPQITEAAKAGVLDARKRGGQFRKVFS